MADPDRAAEGRKLLEGWKREHVAGKTLKTKLSGTVTFCAGDHAGRSEDWPCPTARLIAALETLTHAFCRAGTPRSSGPCFTCETAFAKLTEEAR